MKLEDIQKIAADAVSVAVPEFLQGIEHGEEHYYRFLWLLAGIKKIDGSIVELGTWRGVSAMCLAEGAKHAPVYTLDIGPQVIEMTRRPNIIYAVQDSKSLIPAACPVDILFIDTDHNGDTTADEFNAWLEILSDDAIVLFDDVNLNESMIRFWKNFEPSGFKKATLDMHGGFGVLLREEK